MESAATTRRGLQCAISLRALGDAGAPADAERSKSDRPACGVPGSVNQMSPTSMRQPACASHWRLRAVDAFPLPRHANACRRLGAYRLAVRWHRSIVIGNQMSPTSSRQPVLALLLRAGAMLLLQLALRTADARRRAQQSRSQSIRSAHDANLVAFFGGRI